MAYRLAVGEANHQLIHEPLLIHGARDRDELPIGREELPDQLRGVELTHPSSPLATGAGGQIEQVGIVHHRGHGGLKIGMELRLHVSFEQGCCRGSGDGGSGLVGLGSEGGNANRREGSGSACRPARTPPIT